MGFSRCRSVPSYAPVEACYCIWTTLKAVVAVAAPSMAPFHAAHCSTTSRLTRQGVSLTGRALPTGLQTCGATPASRVRAATKCPPAFCYCCLVPCISLHSKNLMPTHACLPVQLHLYPALGMVNTVPLRPFPGQQALPSQPCTRQHLRLTASGRSRKRPWWRPMPAGRRQQQQLRLSWTDTIDRGVGDAHLDAR